MIGLHREAQAAHKPHKRNFEHRKRHMATHTDVDVGHINCKTVLANKMLNMANDRLKVNAGG